MEHDASPFAALGHPARLAIFRLLARRAPGDVPAGEIAGATGIGASLASAHLAVLERAGLIAARRDGRMVRYRLDLARTGALIDFLVLDCCRGRPELCAPLTAAVLARPGRRDAGLQESPMTDPRPFNVLFVCTGNSARSIFAEAILNAVGGERFRAFSAGTKAKSELNPLAVARLEALGHDVSGLRAKHLSEFQGAGAPVFDFVFTVCDQAANEDCPPWEGQPITGHWSIPDPVAATGTEAERKLAFAEAYRMLRHRISAFANLPLEGLSHIAIQREVDGVAVHGDSPGAGA